MLIKQGRGRRNDITQQTPAEAAIRAAVAEVEKAGCHIWLTVAVNLLQQAREYVADFVEIPKTEELEDDLRDLNIKYEGLLKPRAQEIRVITLTAGREHP